MTYIIKPRKYQPNKPQTEAVNVYRAHEPYTQCSTVRINQKNVETFIYTCYL